MKDFRSARMIVEQLDDVNWRLHQPFSYSGAHETFDVPLGQGTDFASVPRVFVWFLPRYGRYTKAAILHDYLWRERAAKGLMAYVDADGLFRRAMADLGVPFLQRWIMWGAVRWGALVKPGGRRGWWGQAPKLFLVTLAAAPVLVPAAVVGLALAGFYLVEFVLWVPLKLVEMVKRRRRGRVKPANLPDPTWKV